MEILRRTGGLLPRAQPASPALLAARTDVLALLDRWDDGAAQRLAADNFFLDRPLAQWRDETARLRERHGRCRPGDIRPENWLRGEFRAECERGWVDASLTLAPTVPPRLQWLRLVSGMPPSPRLREAAQALAGLAASWTDETAAALAAPGLDLSRLRSQLRAVGEDYGACRPGDAVDGDGTRDQRFRFDCDRGALEASLQLDEAGRLAAAGFAPPAEATCAP
jgi:hypothetical protein